MLRAALMLFIVGLALMTHPAVQTATTTKSLVPFLP
jgi:hypothetical protein